MSSELYPVQGSENDFLRLRMFSLQAENIVCQSTSELIKTSFFLEREILNHVELEKFWKLNLDKIENQIFEFSAQFAFLIRS